MLLMQQPKPVAKRLEVDMTEPTPRPWHNDGRWIHCERGEIIGITSDVTRAHENRGQMVARCKTHARLIVTAVNCHDQLVWVLEQVLLIESRGESWPTDVWESARAVLAKVRELESES